MELDLETEVRLLRYHCLRLVIEDDAGKIYYNTENSKVYHEEDEQMLEIDISHAAIIKKLQTFYPSYVRITDLPLDDDAIKLQIIGDLWEHGLIVTKYSLCEAV